jgi:hypothetical protein
MGATPIEAGLWAFVFFFHNSYADNGAVFLLVWSVTIAYVVILGIAGLDILGSRRRERPRRQLPPRPAPDMRRQAVQHPPSVGPGRQPPPADPGQQHTGEAAPSRLSRPQFPRLGLGVPLADG